jgi:hypothetical protein
MARSPVISLNDTIRIDKRYATLRRALRPTVTDLFPFDRKKEMII